MLRYNLSKVIFFTITSFFILVGCKNIEIIDAYKVKHIASLPNLDNYVEYTLIVKVDIDFKIESIELNNPNFSKKIKEYSFINLKNHSGYKVTKHPKKFKKGTYKFNFLIDQDSSFHLDDILNISYSIDNKSNKIQIKVDKAKVFSNK